MAFRDIPAFVGDALHGAANAQTVGTLLVDLPLRDGLRLHVIGNGNIRVYRILDGDGRHEDILIETNGALERFAGLDAPTTDSAHAVENLFDMAFALGFLATQDGYNGEWAYDHLAPHGCTRDGFREFSGAPAGTIADRIASLEARDDFRRLRDEAWKAIRLTSPAADEV